MALEIKPLKESHKVTYRQPKSEILPRIPFRGLVLAPSNSGKTVSVVNMLTRDDMYKGCFSHVYWCSPSATIDSALDPLREFVSKHLPEQDQETDPTFHDFVDVKFLESRVARQRRIVEYMKKTKQKQHAPAMCIVLDDLADVKRGLPEVAKFVDSAFVKLRHWGVSCVLCTQRLRLPLISPTVRVNVTFALVFRLRANSDLMDGFIEEYASIVPKKTLLEMYRIATDVPYGFLFLNLMEQDRNKIFHNAFKSRFILDSK